MSKERNLDWFIDCNSITNQGKLNLIKYRISGSTDAVGIDSVYVDIYKLFSDVLDPLSIEELKELKETIKLVEL